MKLNFAWILTSWIFCSSFLCCGIVEHPHPWASSMSSWPRRPILECNGKSIVSRSCPAEASPGIFCPAPGSPVQGTWSSWSRSSRGFQRWLMEWSISVMRRGWESWACLARRDEWGGTSSLSVSICSELKQSFVSGWANYDQRRLRIMPLFSFLISQIYISRNDRCFKCESERVVWLWFCSTFDTLRRNKE